MFEKIRLPKDVMIRWIIMLALTCLLAYLVGKVFDPVEIIYIDTDTKWCLEGRYHDTKSIPKEIGDKFITFNNSEVMVFTKCHE